QKTRRVRTALSCQRGIIGVRATSVSAMECPVLRAPSRGSGPISPNPTHGGSSMRLSLRLISALIVGVALVSLLFSYLRVQEEERSLQDDLRMRAGLLAESLQESVQPLLERHSDQELQRMVERFGNREHLAGIAVYDANGVIVARTRGLSAFAADHSATLTRA